MRTLLLALALALVTAACGGTKKPSTTPASADDKEAVDEDAQDRDAARPDDEDDMPSREMADPCNDE